MTQEYIGIKKVTAWPENRTLYDGVVQEGYAVKYEDGYISWSPKEAFEKAYIPIDPNVNVNISISTSDSRVPPNTTK